MHTYFHMKMFIFKVSARIENVKYISYLLLYILWMKHVNKYTYVQIESHMYAM